MGEMNWGLLAPAKIESTRRARTLGVSAAVRAFNELAVPGLGGVWFGKQLLLATLGVALAEDKTGKAVTRIAMANAVEALACCLALKKRKTDELQTSDLRLKGSTKLRGKSDFSFSVVSKPGFYVTQPMRMATVQSLPALGFVTSESARFNAFTCSDAGRALTDMAIPKREMNGLHQWISAGGQADGENMRRVLSPLEPLTKDVCIFIRDQLNRGSTGEASSSKARRQAALAWVDFLRLNPRQIQSWDAKPSMLDGDHWQDLKAGALFFSARDAAIDVLDCVERHMINGDLPELVLAAQIPHAIATAIVELRTRAAAYLDFQHSQHEAKIFCEECLSADDAMLLSQLVKRDDRVLRLRDGRVLPGQAFTYAAASSPEPGTATPAQDLANPESVGWPAGISGRIKNLFLLNADLRGDLSRWLASADSPVESQT